MKKRAFFKIKKKNFLLCSDKVTLPGLLNRIIQNDICDFN